MAKKEVPEDEGPSQEWLASYADAMTLLLAFFIMMFAFALIDEGKFFDFKVGVVAALGIPDPLTDNTDSILEKGSGISPEVGLTPLTPSESQELSMSQAVVTLQDAGYVTEDNAETLRGLLETRIEGAGAGEYVEVGIDERGVFIRFVSHVLFRSGSADLEEEGLIVLATVADVLSLIDNDLEIEGHTDNRPTNGGAWPSNWELSGVRAAGVLRFMHATGGLPETRMLFIGLGDTKPIATNNTAEGRQENRRVEVVVRLAESDANLAPELSRQVQGETSTSDAEPTTDELGDDAGDVVDEGGEADDVGDVDVDADDPGSEADDAANDAGDVGNGIDPFDPIGDPIRPAVSPEDDG